MALSTGNNEICSSVVRRHFRPGMEELVSFAKSLIEARRDMSVCYKMKGHIARASREMGKALEELKGGLRAVDARSVQLVAQKKHLEKKKKAKAQQLSNLRHQLDSHKSQESKSRELLEKARRHLRAMQDRLAEKEADVRQCRRIRNVGLGLMLIPLVGTVGGGLLAVCGQIALEDVQQQKRDAEDEVDRLSADMGQHLRETYRLQDLIEEAETDISTTKRRLSSTEAEKQQLVSQQAEVVRFQNTLRKCVTFLAVLAGKVDTAEFLSRDLVIYSELEGILEEILNHVFPLMGKGRDTSVMALSTSEIRTLIRRLKSARAKLSLELPRQGWRNVEIDF